MAVQQVIPSAPIMPSDAQVIDVEQPTNSSNPNNLTRYEYIDDEQRLWRVFVISVILFLVLIIFPALKMSSTDGEMNENVVTVLIISFVISIQLYIGCFVSFHPSNSSIFGILFILLLSTAISFIEVILVSMNAAIVISMTWFCVIVWVFILHWEVIYSEEIRFSHGIQKLIAVICILLLGYAVRSIVHLISSHNFASSYVD